MHWQSKSCGHGLVQLRRRIAEVLVGYRRDAARWPGLEDLDLEQVSSVQREMVTHVTYRVVLTG